jgi:hypothetical protein
VYNSLLIEANTQLGLLTIPKEIAGNFIETIKTVSYNELKNFMGEDPLTVRSIFIKNFENAQIALNNQLRGIQDADIREGSEPTMRNIIKQENLLDLPNKLINEVLRQLKADNKNVQIDQALFKDNAKLLSHLSEYEVQKKSEDLEEISDSIVIGKGTENERRILAKEIKEKSVEELKALGFQETSSIEVKFDEEGNISTEGNIPEEYAKKMEEEYRLSEKLDETDEIYDGNHELKKIQEIVSSQTEVKVKSVISALETGMEFNDPIYYSMVVTRKEWMENRVNYLKKSFCC